MKKFLFLLGLVVVAVVASGCIQPQSEEQRAIEIADQTAEATLAKKLASAFARLPNCTADEYIETMKGLYVASGVPEEAVPELSSEDRQRIEEALETLKSCVSPLEKSASKAEGSANYLVKYSFEASGACQDPAVVPMLAQEDFLEIEVNTSAGTAIITKGKFPEGEEENIQQSFSFLDTMGDCALLLLMAGSEAEVTTAIPGQ